MLGRDEVELNNLTGFRHWLGGGGTALRVSWHSFDPEHAARDQMKRDWQFANLLKINEECDSMEWNTTKSIKLTSPNLDTVYYSPVGWINGWHGKISGNITNGTDNVDLWKIKDEENCLCKAIGDVRMRAEDRSDFHYGQWFQVFGVPLPDTPFALIRDYTPVGYDYDIYNWEDGDVEWLIDYRALAH
jgi:hypothetical protein